METTINCDITAVIQIEWNMFQEVQNIGGRADCQDDWQTFEIMRRSQYENWTGEMIQCWLSFLKDAKKEGRNLVTEKYARMMAYTEPGYYDKYLAPALPQIPRGNFSFINEIIEILVKWERDFAARYPKLASKSRPVTAAGDASGFTSMETYARGELSTYPRQLLALYLAYVKELFTAGKSLSVMIEDTLVKLYGYHSIEEAEAAI